MNSRNIASVVCMLLAPLAVGCGGEDGGGSGGASSGGVASGGAATGGGSSGGSSGSSSGGAAGSASGGAAGSASGGAAGSASGGAAGSASGGTAGSGTGGAGTGGNGTGGAGTGGNSAQPDYPGQAPAGMLVWGAAVSGNGDPVVRHETPAGHPLAVRRTFFQWSQRTTSMITIAKDDLAHQRLPWVSVKTPSWAAMGAGTHDAEIDQMLTALAALKGPVWLTLHHEPEGGGGTNSPDDPAGPKGHVAMNERVRLRMTATKVGNVALAPILMSWTWDPKSGRNPEEWWKAGIYDFVGVDHYRDAEASLLTTTWATVRTWAKGKGVDVAVGEWGVRGTDAAAGLRVQEWYDAAAGSNKDGKGARVVGLSAFDSSLNSPTGSWELKGEQLTTFWKLLKDARTADVVP
ncbi:MAG: hypothetical protein IPI67_39305 [Myxococcales bacterium]|nr:hypothetical protein [Myxococcales bacterium]